MTDRRPLVSVDGTISELPTGDSLPASLFPVVPYVSDTAPTPANHPLWLDSTTMALYAWYDDGNTTQWVGVSGPAGPQGADGLDGIINIDGGRPDSVYGGIESIDCGGVT